MNHLQRNTIGTLSLLLLTIIALIVVISHGAIAQDSHYHDFADSRSLSFFANASNVLSNVPFFIVGLLGLHRVFIKKTVVIIDDIRYIYAFFFLGTALVAWGSGFYHWAPHNQSLVWDRLPMTITFMSLFSIVIAEYVSLTIAKRIFIPLVVLGIYSVLYWYCSEMSGHGDLRLYVIVQFLPLLMMPLVVTFFPAEFSHRRGYWLLLLAYVMAKLFEHFDAQIFSFTGFMSGHSLKHIAAALGIYALLRSFEKRDRIL